MLFIIMMALSACDPKFECDSHPETCPGLIVKITSSSIVKKLAPSKLEFSVSIQANGKPEDPANIKAAIVSTTDAACRQALTTDPKPTARLDLPMPTTMPDGSLAYSVQPTAKQLAPLLLGQAKLCVYGRDIGETSAYIMNKLLKFAGVSSLPESLSGTFTAPKPNSISISNNRRIYLLFSYDSGGVFERDMRSYTYSPLTNVSFGIKITGKSIFAPALAGPITMPMPNLMKMLLLRPNMISSPTRFELYLCDLMATSCSTDNNMGNKWNIPDGGIIALATDRAGGKFFVATQSATDGLRSFDISTLATTDPLTSKALWTADKPTNGAKEKTILALGDLAGADGNQELIAAQSTSHDVSVFIQPSTLVPTSTPSKLSRDPTYSAALQAKVLQALTPLGGGTPADLSALSVGDLDGDGLADIVIGYGQQLRVIFNMGNGAFRLSGEYPMNNGEEKSLIPDPTAAPIVDISIGDIGTGGNQLIVLTGSTDATITVYQISTM